MKFLFFLLVLVLTLTGCGANYYQISSFYLDKIEFSDKPDIGAVYKLTGKDQNYKTIFAFSPKLGGVYPTITGICYMLTGYTIESDLEKRFKVISSFPTICPKK